ncbi:hypothetical protein FQN54_008051 [Arachnomyces sp. PD_36]|nr:hypothetical protein FQN54_008051 [Arachnomyces sp. PD_36]
MSGKLDQSLDEILSTRRGGSRRGTRNRASRGGKAQPAAAAPVGGIKKATKNTKATGKSVPTGPSGASGESKIIVSGLPPDVNEANIKEYFTKSAGPVKRVMVTYNQNGTSRGIAALTFTKRDTAAKAAKDLNGLLVDGRPMKIEVVVDATHAPAVPAAKPLTERVAQGKSQPKPVTAAKTAGTTRTRGARGRTRRGRNAGRPKPKTAEELDAEMVDYFGANNTGDNAQAANTNGAAQPAAANNDDLGMDEIS